MTFRTVVFKWDSVGEVMRLAPRFRRVAAEQFNDGEEYGLVPREADIPADKERAAFFADVRKAWQNLRGETAETLESERHLRGWALIQTGHCDQTVLPCPNKETAIAWAVFARKMVGHEDGYAEVSAAKVDGSWFLRIKVPRSMTRSSMKIEEFRVCAEDCRALMAGVIEVTKKQLSDAARKDAQ